MSSWNTVAELDAYLATRSYVKGYSFSEEDKKAFAKIGSAIPDAAATPNAYRWALHVIALTGVTAVSAASTGAAAAPAKKAAAPAAKKAAAEDDDMDLFGDEEEVDDDGETAAEKAANAARAERMAQALRLKEEKDAREGKVKKEKAKAVEKSLVVLEVKPWEADTDLVALWHEIVKYQQDGLTWGESYKLEPVAFGIKKLVLTCTIVDAQVLMEDITDAIEKLEDYVQSVNVASMNKIS